MTMSMYQASVPVFVQMLTGLSGVLDKAEAYATEKKIDQANILGMRLHPSMWALSKQVVAATDMARNGVARLAGKEPLVIEETEKTFADLRGRIKKTIEYVQSFKPADIDGTEAKELKIKMGPNERTFKGQDYLQGFINPNFYFFCTTAYDILRQHGVDLNKRDFLGKVPGQ
jgi:uncharacterized protein